MAGWCIDEEADAIDSEAEALYDFMVFIDGPA